MTRTLITALALAGLAVPGFAQDSAPLDADGDGFVTVEELQAVYPDLTAETFTMADTDADGVLSEEELGMAMEGGLFPMPNDG